MCRISCTIFDLIIIYFEKWHFLWLKINLAHVKYERHGSITQILKYLK